MDIEGYLKEKSLFIEAALDRLIPGLTDYPQNLYGAMRHSLFAGGKRLRPALVLAACEAVGGDVEDAVNTACAFECVHTYSLIHDDLPAIDDDDMRRGQPTCHKQFGEASAILAGDALLTIAFEMIADTPHVEPSRLIRVVSELARGSGHSGMIGGQVVDIESEGCEISFPVLEHIHIHKTGALIVAALKSGAIIGGADAITIEKLTRYGEALGLAFQVADDILNVEGTSEELGKAVGSDEERGKATYPAIVGLKESKEMATALGEKALEALLGMQGSQSDTAPNAAPNTVEDRIEPLRALIKFVIERNN